MVRRKAVELLEAASGGPPGEVTPELARLLAAVEILRTTAPGAQAPDETFASGLRSNLLARYDELASSEPEKPVRRVRRIALVAIPAVAVAAALAVAIILFLVEPARKTPAIARLTVQNGIARVVSGGRVTTVTKAADVRIGDTVDAASGSRATITYGNRNITRLEAGTRLEVLSYTTDNVVLEQDTGKTYNRVMKGSNYTVLARSTIAQSVGTAFGVDITGTEVSVPVFEGEAKAGPLAGSRRVVEQGNVAKTAVQDGRLVVTVTPLDLATLDFSWLAFNRDLDQKAGFPLGVLENLAPTPPEGVLPPGAPPSSAPGSSAPRSTSPGSSQPPDSAPATNPQPSPTPGRPSAGLSLEDAGPPVVISWTSQNTRDATGIAVLRVAGGGTPAYPGNSIATLPAGAGSFKDGAVQSGQVLTYRVAYLAGGAVLVYSNPVTVSIPAPPPPPPELNLSGDGSASSMYLSWSLSSGAADEFVILRAEGRAPGYPADYYSSAGGGSGGKFIDTDVGSANSLSYRVVALSGGRVIATSNTVEYRPQ